MKIINGLEKLTSIKNKTYITFGNFDGFHTGHQLVLNYLIDIAKKESCKTMLITFEDSSKVLLKKLNLSNQNQEKEKKIFSSEVKKKILRSLRIDYLFILNFEEVKKIEYSVFLDLIIRKINFAGIIASDKLSFGYQKKGSPKQVQEYLSSKNCHNIFFPSIKVANEHLSSSMIRGFLKKGKIFKANEKLFLPFHLVGKVVKGKKMGRTIGFPTINFLYPENIIRIPSASYITLTVIGGEMYPSMSFIGIPFGENKDFLVETYLLNFSKTVYNIKVEVYFLRILEKRQIFKNVSFLKVFLNKQLKIVDNFFKNNQQDKQIKKIYNFIKIKGS